MALLGHLASSRDFLPIIRALTALNFRLIVLVILGILAIILSEEYGIPVAISCLLCARLEYEVGLSP